MARRDRKAGYKKRVARKQAPGVSRAQTGGRDTAHARSPIDDRRIEAAILEMNRGRSLTAAARATHISRPRLGKLLARHGLAKRKGRRWAAKDYRLRRVPVMTRGRTRVLTVRGYDQARLVGEHHEAAGEFVRTNNLAYLTPFEGRTVQAANGRRHVLETDANALHRIATMDSPPFHEIYEITSNS